MQYLKLKKIREERGLTLKQVGRATHYSDITINFAENMRRYQGKKKDSRRDDFWRAMSDFYGVPAEELQEVIE